MVAIQCTSLIALPQVCFGIYLSASRVYEYRQALAVGLPFDL